MSRLFKQAPVQVQNNNGFDKGFLNSFSGKCGTLYPIICNQVMPGTKISYGFSAEVQLPPMATDFYGTIEYCVEAFFVPCRILYGGFKNFITHDDTTSPPYPDGARAIKTHTELPFFKIPKDSCGLGSLQDFLGLKQKAVWPELATHYYISNPLKHLSYAKIYDDWYRDSRLQTPLFMNPYANQESSRSLKAYELPYTNFSSIVQELEFSPDLYDNSKLYDLRQRNFSKDYFTNATLQPQSGNDVALTFSAEGSDDGNGLVSSVGSFTIRGLRAANTLQLWRERNNMAGNRYADQMKARFGVYPSDAITDRPIYLGSKRFTVYNKSVYQTFQVEGSLETRNPFSSVGSKYSSPLGVLPREKGQIVNDFFTTEYGYFVVIGSLVPKVMYSSGTDRHLWDRTLADFADPILAQVGDQPIYKEELFDNTGGISPEFGLSFNTFGYTQRYSHWKFIDDQVHGELSDDGSLNSFALQRSFDSLPDLSSEFITIPTNYMDNVTAITASMSNYGYWIDTYNDLKVSQPLPAYSIPTLGNPVDTHTEFIPLGGTRL